MRQLFSNPFRQSISRIDITKLFIHPCLYSVDMECIFPLLFLCTFKMITCTAFHQVERVPLSGGQVLFGDAAATAADQLEKNFANAAVPVKAAPPPTEPHYSAWETIPTDLQQAIFFHFLRPAETLRLRVLSKYFKALIDALACNRLILYCGPAVAGFSPAAQLALSVNHLRLFQAVYASFPQSTSQADFLGLLILAYFMNVESFEQLKTQIAKIKQYLRSNDLLFFELPTSRNRLGVFKSLSKYLHAHRLPMALEVLYGYYCRGANESIRTILFEDKCRSVKSDREVAEAVESFAEGFFSQIPPGQMLLSAILSHNAIAIVALLRRFNLRLPDRVNGQHILHYFIFYDIYDAELASHVPFDTISRAVYDNCLELILYFAFPCRWFMHILQLAPVNACSPVLADLKRVLVDGEASSATTVLPENILLLMLVALGQTDEASVRLFWRLLPALSPDYISILTRLALYHEVFLSILMLENEHVAPCFCCPESVRFRLCDNGRAITLVPSKEIIIVPARIANVLGEEVFKSRWFHKAFLLTTGPTQYDYDMSQFFLRSIAVFVPGHETLAISLRELQAKTVALPWLTEPSLPPGILDEPSWSALELAILLLNPEAVRRSLLPLEARHFFQQNRDRMLTLAWIVKKSLSEEAFVKRADDILEIIRAQVEEESSSSGNSKRCVSVADCIEYRVEDTSPLIRFKTVPLSELFVDAQ